MPPKTNRGLGMNAFWVIGIVSLMIGATICSVSAMTLRPDVTDTEYNDKLEAKQERGTFIYMIGIVFFELGLLCMALVFTLLILSTDSSKGTKITAMILGVFILLMLFFTFVLSSPMRFLSIGGI